MPKLHYQKMKSRANNSSLASEETGSLSNDGIGNNKCAQHSHGAAKKKFTIVLTSNNPNVFISTKIAKIKVAITHFFMRMLQVSTSLSLQLKLTLALLNSTGLQAMTVFPHIKNF